MAEKTTFSDMVPDSSRVTMPERCCGKCAHGRPMTDPGQLGRRMVLCKAGPPIPVVMIRNNQPMVVSQWPPLDVADPGCDAFERREEQNPSS